jgi:ABC-2 type transport system permease protein
VPEVPARRATAELGPRARLWPALVAVYRAQLSRARVARIPLLFVATFQSIGIMILMRGVVDGGGEARAVVAGASVLVVAFVALNLLAQYFGQLRASGGLDHYATLPVPPAAVVLGAAGAYASFTVPGTVVTAVFGCLLFGLPLAHLWVLALVIPLAGAALAGLGAAFGLLAPRPELATLLGQLGMSAALLLGVLPAERMPGWCGSRGICCPRRTAWRPSRGPSGPIPTGPSSSVTSPCARGSGSSRWPSRPGRTAGRPSGDAPHSRAWHDVRVTAPLTPPPPPHEPTSPHEQPLAAAGSLQKAPDSRSWQDWPAPAASSGGRVRTAYGQDGPGMKTEVREAAVVTVVVALGGVLLGLLWWWLAPSVPLVGNIVDKSWVVYLKDSEGEQAIGVDGTFTLLALALGAVSALGVFLFRRRGGVPLVVALTVGGLLGSVLAWRLGVWLGPAQDVIAAAKSAGKGVTFSAPLKLGAKGALLAWSVAALVMHLGLTALFGPRDAGGGRGGYRRFRGEFPRPRRPYPSHPWGLRPQTPAPALNGPCPQTPDGLKCPGRRLRSCPLRRAVAVV